MGTRGCGDFYSNIPPHIHAYGPAKVADYGTPLVTPETPPHVPLSPLFAPGISLCICLGIANGKICQLGNFSLLPRGPNLGHDGDCYPTLCGWRTVPMKTRRPLNYLRSYRLRWGLSQGELANLLGCKTAGVISRIEKKLRSPTLKIVIGCFVLFGTPAAEVFPDISGTVEADVMERVWELYEKVQGDPSRKTKTKIELLESVIERAERSMHKPRV
jgi:transcriptional regulator with XRE-family HTH domain